MATAKGTELLIEIGDGQDPEVFSAPCGINTKNFNREAATNTFDVPDCDNPDDPAWLERVVQSFSSSISGGGQLHTQSSQIWDDFFTSGLPKNLKITVPGVGVFIGEYILTGFDLSGNRGELVSVDVTLESNGPVVKQP